MPPVRKLNYVVNFWYVHVFTGTYTPLCLLMNTCTNDILRERESSMVYKLLYTLLTHTLSDHRCVCVCVCDLQGPQGPASRGCLIHLLRYSWKFLNYCHEFLLVPADTNRDKRETERESVCVCVLVTDRSPPTYTLTTPYQSCPQGIS